MERYRFGRVVVKVGSTWGCCLRDDGTLDTTRMSALSDQIAQLHRGGVEDHIGFVRSRGRGPQRVGDGAQARLGLGAPAVLGRRTGQADQSLLRADARHRGILCGQVLTTKESFSTRRHYLNQQHCMTVMLDHGVIPIVNENDTVSVTELMFTDNDELSGLIAAMMDAEALIILSDIDGIYNGDPSDPASAVIRTVEPHRDDLSGYIQTGRSQFGRGGMLTKYRMASKVADEGIEVTVANGKRDGILTDLLSPGSDVVSTRFVPASHSISQVKKWIAHSEGFAKGELHINEGAYRGFVAPRGDEPASGGRLSCRGRIREGRHREDRFARRHRDRRRPRVACDSERARQGGGARRRPSRWRCITIISIWIKRNKAYGTEISFRTGRRGFALAEPDRAGTDRPGAVLRSRCGGAPIGRYSRGQPRGSGAQGSFRSDVRPIAAHSGADCRYCGRHAQRGFAAFAAGADARRADAAKRHENPESVRSVRRDRRDLRGPAERRLRRVLALPEGRKRFRY